MAPTALMMCHNPATLAFGNQEDRKKAIEMLEEVKESIINAYEIKTGLSRNEISKLMDEETWMNAKKAMELGFCDALIEDEKKKNGCENSYSYSGRTTEDNLKKSLVAFYAKKEPEDPGIKISDLEKRLNLLKR